MASTIAFRAAIHHLTATPAEELPSIAAYLARTLGESGSILAASESYSKTPGGPATALLATKLKARITSLLQDKSVEGRWTAIILVKAVVEAGQWEILRGCEAWVRSLLTILGKPDPVSSKKLSILTLTRIFQFALQYPTLTRELVTPSLPSFITACLNTISVKSPLDGKRTLKQNSPLIAPVFSSFLEALPNHPSIFRPFTAQIHDLVLPLIGSSSVSAPISKQIILLAQRLFISLHHCAPKNTSDGEWSKAYLSTVASVHRLADTLFRSIIEQWESVDPARHRSSRSQNYSSPIGDSGQNSLGLPGWQGVREGAARLVGLVDLLTQFLLMPTHSTVSIPIGVTLDLTARFASLAVPAAESGNNKAHMINREISRDERESLFSELPCIYVSALKLLRVLTTIFATGAIPIAQICLNQALWIFEMNKGNNAIRLEVYQCIAEILTIMGYTLTKPELSLLAPVVRSACVDLLPMPTESQPTERKGKGNQVAVNADAFLGTKAPKSASNTVSQGSRNSKSLAGKLLVSFISCAPAELIPLPLRAEIDRSAILTGHTKLMAACVLNPIPPTATKRGHSSIMPFLARVNTEHLEIEGLLRPRMPVLMTGTGKSKFDPITHNQDSDMEDEVFETTGGFQSVPSASTAENPVFLESTPRPMHIDSVSPDTRGTKRAHNSEDQLQTEADGSEDQSQVLSSGKKARTDPHPSTLIVSQRGEEVSVETISIEPPREASANTPLIPESGSNQAESLLTRNGTIQLETVEHWSTISSTLPENPNTGNDENVSSDDDEIPQLNIEPDTEDEDSIT